MSYLYCSCLTIENLTNKLNLHWGLNNSVCICIYVYVRVCACACACVYVRACTPRSDSCSCQHHSNCQSSWLKLLQKLLVRNLSSAAYPFCCVYTQRLNRHTGMISLPPLAQSVLCMPGSPPNLASAALF